MIRIQMDELTLERARLAISPLQEVVRGIELVHRTRDGRSAPWPYVAWTERAREVLRTVPETGPLRLFAQLYGEDHGRPTPDAFEPPPLMPRPSLADELAVLRRTPADLLAEQCAKHYPEGVPPFLAPYLDDAPRALGLLADAFEAFWEQAMAPHWPAMRAVLEVDVLLRARALAEDGPETVLGGLSAEARWESPTLSLRKRRDSALDGAGRRLLLVPLVFAQGRPSCSTDDPRVQMITYQARGAAVLAGDDRPPAAEPDALAQLIGPGRAGVLRELRTPITTSGLAAVLGRAVSTVSEQLSALQTAGVVSRSRFDKQVLNGLEPAGVALLSLFGGVSDPAETFEGDVGGP